MWLQRELFDLAYSINLLGNEGTTFTNGAEKGGEVESADGSLQGAGHHATWRNIRSSSRALRSTGIRRVVEAGPARPPLPLLRRSPGAPAAPRARRRPRKTGRAGRGWSGGRLNRRLKRGQAAAANAAARFLLLRPPRPLRRTGRGRGGGSTEPYMNAVFEAAQYVDASDPSYTFITYKPGEARDMPVLKAGNVAAPGEIVPRGFPAVLAKGDPTFKQGSGRLELADRIFTDAPGLAARVIVNRVWGWHFGRGLVATPSDFGTQGDKPTHPELLDDLAARFIAHGWSLKWLNKEIMMSAAYQQSSNPRAGRPPGRRGQRAVVAAESAAAGCRGLPRHADAVGRRAGSHDGRSARRSSISDTYLQAHDLRTRQPRARPRRCWRCSTFPKPRRRRRAATSRRRRCSRFS